MILYTELTLEKKDKIVDKIQEPMGHGNCRLGLRVQKKTAVFFKDKNVDKIQERSLVAGGWELFRVHDSLLCV